MKCRRRRSKPKPLTAEQIAIRSFHLSTCDHPSQLVENARGRMERCPCWKRADQAIREVGHVKERGER